MGLLSDRSFLTILATRLHQRSGLFALDRWQVVDHPQARMHGTKRELSEAWTVDEIVTIEAGT